jgi:hypothetical protein
MTSEMLPLVTETLPITSGLFPVDGRSRPPEESTPANGQPLTLAEVVDHEAMGYRAWGTPVGDFLARQMERLAQLVRWTDAATPEDHEARMEVWDEEIREQWFERGYHEGYEAGRRDAGRRRGEGWER